MLWMEGEPHYTREINILLLLHSQRERGVSLENLCPPDISFCTEEEKIFLFFDILRVEEEFHCDKQKGSTS